MLELIAVGPKFPEDRGQYWQKTLPRHEIRLGRAESCDWEVPWDQQISRWHATLVCGADGRLNVRKNPNAKNRIFVRGDSANEFTLAVGEQFVIGDTTFTFQEHASNPDLTATVQELTCSRQELEQVKYVDAAERIDILAALPGIIRYSPSEEELEIRVLDVLLKGIPGANDAALVSLNATDDSQQPDMQVRRVASRYERASSFQPSRRLVIEAVRRRRQSVLHAWNPDVPAHFTVSPHLDWAICTPLPDEPLPGWALYVSGQHPEPSKAMPPDARKGDLKFTEVVGDIFGALRQVRDLQQRHASLARLLSQPVLAALFGKNMDEVLRPRKTEVTVLFCDLRGSCLFTEEGDLNAVCERMNEALSIMTSNIVDKGGVIADFQGDAAMGFWGWPLDDDEQVEKAARAALAIWRTFARFAQRGQHQLSGFACGIGIAHGTAIAGRLGTMDQLKVGVFGPVVNLAARLESMTKMLRVPILIDENCSKQLTGERVSYWARFRRVARVRPYGMTKDVTVCELLPPAVEPGAMHEQVRRDYEAALDFFTTGQWASAHELLKRLPENIGHFLKSYIDKHKGTPPVDWDGVIGLEGK